MTMFRFARRLVLVVAADALVPTASVGQVGGNTLPCHFYPSDAPAEKRGVNLGVTLMT